MIAPVPATKFNDLLTEVTGMLFAGRRDDFRLVQMERDASNLVKVAADEGWQIRGYLCAVKGDLHGVHSAFRTAVRLDPDADTWRRYVQALVEGGWFADARKVLLEQVKARENDKEFLAEAIEALGSTGWISDVETLSETLQELGRPSAMHLRGATELLRRRGLSVEELQAPIGYARTFLKRHHVKMPQSRARIVNLDDPEPAIAYDLIIEATPEAAVDLEMELYREFEEKNFAAEESRGLLVTLSSKPKNRANAEHA